MKTQLPFGLRLASGISAVVALIYGVSAIVAPGLVASLAGLPGVDLPVYQQAGGLTLGAAVASYLILQASRWEQVRVAVAGIFVNVLLSALGAFYYVVWQGVVSVALLGILIYTTYASVAFGYYLWAFRETVDEPGLKGA